MARWWHQVRQERRRLQVGQSQCAERRLAALPTAHASCGTSSRLPPGTVRGGAWNHLAPRKRRGCADLRHSLLLGLHRDRGGWDGGGVHWRDGYVALLWYRVDRRESARVPSPPELHVNPRGVCAWSVVCVSVVMVCCCRPCPRMGTVRSRDAIRTI